MMIRDVVIVGGGAAGLMCAIEAGKRGRQVTLLEHNQSIGKKIRISGGGRCNFTNLNAAARNYLSCNEHFVKSALARYAPEDFIHFVEGYQIPFHEKTLGQLFCDNSSQDIIGMLNQEAKKNKVEILLSTTIQSVKKDGPFVIQTNHGTFNAEHFVVATGGLSIPELGSTAFGYTLAQQFGIAVTPCRPGLVPLTWSKQDLEKFKGLAGVSFDSIVSFRDMAFHEKTLFTHKGLSGPAILQISSYWQPNEPITINFFPNLDIFEYFKNHHASKLELKSHLRQHIPQRLAEVLCQHDFLNKPLNQFPLTELKSMANLLHHYPVTPAGSEGYAKAEVTVGGVDTSELSSKSLESLKVPGLYFIGEVVDVTGWLGGYNFQWAWASGFAAGQYV